MVFHSQARQIMIENLPGFEAVLFPAFQDILQKDVTEFIPYVFQVQLLVKYDVIL